MATIADAYNKRKTQGQGSNSTNGYSSVGNAINAGIKWHGIHGTNPSIGSKNRGKSASNRAHHYVKRTGTPGNYKYYYYEPVGNRARRAVRNGISTATAAANRIGTAMNTVKRSNNLSNPIAEARANQSYNNTINGEMEYRRQAARANQQIAERNNQRNSASNNSSTIDNAIDTASRMSNAVQYDILSSAGDYIANKLHDKINDDIFDKSITDEAARSHTSYAGMNFINSILERESNSSAARFLRDTYGNRFKK